MSSPSKKTPKKDTYPDLSLKCIYCGSKAEISGRWHNARVVCRSCGMESGVDLYRDQIEDWQDKVCAELFSE